MRVVLVNPPDELDQVLGVGTEFIQKYEPLGILFIAAVLIEAGHDVVVIDAHAENLKAADILERIEALIDQAGSHFTVVGFSTLTCNGAQVFDMGQQIKNRYPDVKVILGNIHASVFAKYYLLSGCCDVVVHGEGEYVVASLVERFADNQEYDDISGISLLTKDGEVKRNLPDGYIQDLGELPFPARDLVDQSLYGLSAISNQPFIPGKRQHVKTIVTSRGCPYRCAFCVVHANRKPRYDPPKKVVDELELLEKQYNATYAYIEDSLFLADRQRIFDICDLYHERSLTIRWGAQAHVRHVDAELINAIKSAGCFDLSLGLESGSQRILDSIHKGFKIEQAIKAVKTIKDNSDISVSGLFILGLPGETHQDIMATIKFACSLPIDFAQFSIFTPYPGSPLFDKLAANGELDTGIRPNGRVDTSVWTRYAQYIMFKDVDPIWTPEGMTPSQLRSYQKRAMRSFYLRPRQILRQVKRLRYDNFWKALRIIRRGFY